MEMKLPDAENISQGEAAASRIPVPPASGDSGSAAAVVNHVRKIPEQSVHVKPSTVHAQKQPVIVQKISLDLLAPSPFNSRKFRPEQSVQDMAQSLFEDGQIEALHVYPGRREQQGKYLVLSGVTRLLAATTLGWSALDVIVDSTLNPDDPLSLIAISRLHNKVSKEIDMDHAATIADLEKQGYSKAAIMVAMGFRSSRKLFKLRAFRELPQAILDIAVRYPNKISAEFADVLKGAVSTLGEDKAVLLADELVKENLSVKNLIKRVQAEHQKITNSPAQATKERGTLIQFGNRKIGEIRVMRYSDSGEREVQLRLRLSGDDVIRNSCDEIEKLIHRMMEKW